MYRLSFLLAAALLAVVLALPTAAQDRAVSPSSLEAALDHVRGQAATSAGLTAEDVADLAVSSAHTNARSGLTHVYVQQRIGGIDVAESMVSVSLDASDKVAYAAGDLVAGTETASKVASLPATAALARAAAIVGTPVPPTRAASGGGGADRSTTFGTVAETPVTARLVYVGSAKDGIRLAWQVILPTPDGQHIWDVRLDAQTGEEIARYDRVIHESFLPETPQPVDLSPVRALDQRMPLHLAAPQLSAANSYLVYAMPEESPTWGSPGIPGDARVTAVGPADATASPFGWHDDDGVAGADYTITRGNNVYAYTDVDGNNVPDAGSSPSGGPSLDFSAAMDLSMDADTYRPAAVINLFYWNNIIHDVMVQYGFTEAAGNFQTTNYSGNGAGGDAVLAEAQNAGNCNANFATPTDGGAGRMQMYTCDPTSVGSPAGPVTDSDLDNGVIIHEYGHGISNRLTGGPATSSCLNNSEQMGEGWSDYYGLMLTMEATDTRTTLRPIGNFLLGQPPSGEGIRGAGFQPAPGAPYTTDFGVNSATYGDTNAGLSAPHGVGFVWATILWEVTWDMIDAYGFDPDIYDAGGSAGNQVMMNLVTAGLMIQPCSPGFVDGRDAILAADAAIYGGAHTSTLWAAFARRGLGASADQGSSSSRSDQIEAFDAPITPGSFAYSPSSISVTLPTNTVTTETMTLENNAAPGDADITWSAAVTNATPPSAAKSLAGSGGPDAFGYVWTDSDEPGGPAVAFEDISGSGTAVTFTAAGSFPAGDEGYADIALPFAFPFYGAAETSVRVFSNGFATFSALTGNTFTNGGIPATGTPNALIAPFWDDLDQSVGGTVYTGTTPDGRFAVQWDGVPRYSDTGSSVTFQLLLSADGTVEYQYGTMTATTLSSASVGIENADGTDGLGVAINAAYVASDKAVRFVPPATYISLSAGSGTISPGGSAGLDVSFDATGMADGTYTADLLITTNDPSATSVTVPITMVVADGVAAEFTIATAGAYILAPPADGFTVDDLAAFNLVIGVPGYNDARARNLLSEVDGDARWTEGAGTGDVLPLGRGFRWILSGADRDYGSGSVSRPLPTTLSEPAPNTADVTLDLQTAGRGINIFGNPFGVPLDISGIATWPGGTKLSANVFTWDVSTKRWVYSAALSEIAPWQGFFVRTRPGRTGTVTIPASAAVGSAAWHAAQQAKSEPAAPSAASVGVVRFALDGRARDGAPLSDGAFALTVGASAEAEPKLAPLSTAYVTAAFAGPDGLRAVEALPELAGGASVELPVQIQTAGAERSLVLRWAAPTALPDGWRVTLVDRVTGAEADVSSAGSYAFEHASAAAREIPAEVGVLDGDGGAARFALRVEAGGPAAKTAAELSLSTPQPNPVRGTARVPFTLAAAGPVRLTVVDALGREVAVLAEGDRAAGEHEVAVGVRDLASGMYLLRLAADGEVLLRRFTVAR